MSIEEEARRIVGALDDLTSVLLELTVPAAERHRDPWPGQNRLRGGGCCTACMEMTYILRRHTPECPLRTAGNGGTPR